MELQLGLALSCNGSNKDGMSLDLNSLCVYEAKEEEFNRKRSFCDAFEDRREGETRPTLPLLVWNNHPNDEDDGSKDLGNNFSFAFNKSDEEDDGIVGWPPIKFRKKKQRCQRSPNNKIDNGCVHCYGRPLNSSYVKVKMEGVAIARKVDVSLYLSFQSLKETLFHMFGIGQENFDKFKLTYQDREGDWLLAEDVPWRSFMENVQRLKLMRSNG